MGLPSLPYFPAWYGKTLVSMITVCCGSGFLLFGYDQGVMAGIIGADNQFGRDFGHPSPSLQGTILAIYEVSRCNERRERERERKEEEKS
jgi:hypothetical protein